MKFSTTVLLSATILAGGYIGDTMITLYAKEKHEQNVALLYSGIPDAIPGSAVMDIGVEPRPQPIPVLPVERETLVPPPVIISKLGPVNEGQIQRHCLALNIYHEAKNQSIKGQMAVAFVTLNRVISSKFPNTICSVVKQARYWKTHPIRNKCHFSWWCDGKSDKPKNEKAWTQAQTIADTVVDNYDREPDITEGSLWYHADYVRPYWKSKYTQTVKIEKHIFYKDS